MFFNRKSYGVNLVKLINVIAIGESVRRLLQDDDKTSGIVLFDIALYMSQAWMPQQPQRITYYFNNSVHALKMLDSYLRFTSGQPVDYTDTLVHVLSLSFCHAYRPLPTLTEKASVVMEREIELRHRPRV